MTLQYYGRHGLYEALENDRRKCIISVFTIISCTLVFEIICYCWLSEMNMNELLKNLPLPFFILITFMIVFVIKKISSFKKKVRSLVLPEILKKHFQEVKFLEDSTGTVTPYMNHLYSVLRIGETYYEESCIELGHLKIFNAKIKGNRNSDLDGLICKYSHPLPLIGFVKGEKVQPPKLSVIVAALLVFSGVTTFCYTFLDSEKMETYIPFFLFGIGSVIWFMIGVWAYIFSTKPSLRYRLKWTTSKDFLDSHEIKSIVGESVKKLIDSNVYSSIYFYLDKDGVVFLFPSDLKILDVSLFRKISAEEFEQGNEKFITVLSELHSSLLKF